MDENQPPTLVRNFLKKSKMDQFGQGAVLPEEVEDGSIWSRRAIFIGATGNEQNGRKGLGYIPVVQ